MARIHEKQLFTKRLRLVLEKAGLNAESPTEISREFNHHFSGEPVTVYAVRKWLEGKSIPAQEKMTALAAWLNVSPEWLRFGTSEMMRREETQEIEKLENLMLVRNYRKLKLEHQVAVREMITALLPPDSAQRGKWEEESGKKDDDLEVM